MIDAVVIKAIEDYFDDLKEKAVAKFIAGRKEHNDSLLTLDCDKEIEDEMIDVLVYTVIKNQQLKKKKECEHGCKLEQFDL